MSAAFPRAATAPPAMLWSDDTAKSRMTSHTSSAYDRVATRPQQQPNNQTDVEPLEKTATSIRKLSIGEKLGFWGIIITCTAPIFMLAAMGVLSFMWLADASNHAWRSMMVNNWLNTAVAICTEVLKQAMSFQLGIMIAMLAALALERSEVLLPYTAFFSMIRAAAGAGTTVEVMWSYLRSMWRHRRKGSYRQFVTVVFWLSTLSAAMFAFTQVISVVLFTDVDLDVIPGLKKEVNTTFGFQNVFRREGCQSFTINGSNVYCNGEAVDESVLERIVPRLVDRGGTWARKAAEYPSFAEYSEPPYEAEGGSVKASRSTPRLGNVTVTKAGGNNHRHNESVPFACMAPLPYTKLVESVNFQPQWQLSICQLGSFSGGLVSEFNDISTWWDQTTGSRGLWSSTYGAAYLFLNVTAIGQLNLPSYGDDGITGWASRQRNEWFDMVWEKGNMSTTISSTLCYSAFGFADLDVAITSSANRTEPKPTFNDPARIYNFTGIRQLYGQPNMDAHELEEDRGILRLEKPQKESPWVLRGEPASYGEPFMRAYADLGTRSRTGSTWMQDVPWPLDSRLANVSAMLCETETPLNSGDETYDLNSGASILRVMADVGHVWLVQEILREGGSIAFALQSMITLLSSMSYYDQIGQFDNFTMSEQAYYVVASVRVKKVGFVVVVVAVLAHLVLAGAVLVVFLNSTSFSRIGETWTVLSQVVVPEGAVTKYVNSAGMQGDDEVEATMERDGYVNSTAKLADTDGRLRIIATGRETVAGSATRLHSQRGLKSEGFGNHDYQVIPRE
ncbi:hypothetical protein QBC40DRAFT_302285 [Triangularia verruculosa]|uniref:Uncharacterized protein n=1 Tax=Triangularia verruculosa TaxID=2587418 RepID=A0AAN7AQT2_9PEZI|nr:hypothetical protein QBC40DRAFT_302285 [Triangularia verruculosa]